jgi:AraC family transcriptional regulator
MKTDWETLVPMLVHIQANLDGDLSLRALAMKAGLSPFHFQRLFKDAFGETPKTYTLRLRLERAAFRLALHETNLLDLALECGFRNHESFTRAFRRRFDCAPSVYRDRVRRRAEWWSHQSRQILDDPARQFAISSTRVVQLRPTHLAFTRHVGPYESVPQSLFDELEQWAARRIPPGPPVWMGIGHDSPATTPPEQLRFDASLRVAAPFAPEGRIAYSCCPAATLP